VKADPVLKMIPSDSFRLLLQSECDKAMRYQYFFSLLIVENDQSGKSGNVPMLIEIISRALRESDLMSQDNQHRVYLILHSLEESDVYQVGERIRSYLEGQNLMARNRNDNITVSIGGACFPTHATDPQELLKVADQMVQRAKDQGGNRICLPEMEV
jgi:diguanylate cyclase (GGDEF)-like protein